MNQAIISAAAALAGSAIGTLAPVLSNLVLQRSATQREVLNRELTDRQPLYSGFITSGSQLYVDSVTQNLQTGDQLVRLYALVSRIRLLGAQSTVSAAEDFVRLLVQQYGESNRTLADVRTLALS
jgi:hypothetical protein